MNMKSPLICALLLTSLLFLDSCIGTEDPGPLQEIEREYAVHDFERLEIGDALHIDVEQGNYFEISVRGDRRNVDDLEVYKEGTTLVVRFDESGNRRHDTYITITMPDLRSANFSGASDSRISGFYELETLDIILSGASVSQLDIETTDLDLILSGASTLTLRGSGQNLNAELSGASLLRAFDFPVALANLYVSGASNGRVAVSEFLHASASGASTILYRGNATVDADVSDTSMVRKD
jgi:hypothetical protein